MDQQAVGVAFTLAFVMSSTLLSLAVKTVSASTTTIMFARYNIALILLIPCARHLLKRQCSIWMHLSRAALVFIINFLTYYGQQHAAFMNVNLISMSEPFFVFLYSSLLSRPYIKQPLKSLVDRFYNRQRISERKHDQIIQIIDGCKPLTYKKLSGLLLGYLGVLVIIIGKTAYTGDNTLLGNLSMIAANILNAALLFQSRYMSVMENVKTLLIYNALCLWLFGWLINPGIKPLTSLGQYNTILLVIIGILACGGYFLYINGLSRLKPEVYSPILYTRIIFASVLSYFFLNESFGLQHVVGASLILYGLWVVNKK